MAMSKTSHVRDSSREVDSWRKSEKENSRPKSQGISPKHFHGKRGQQAKQVQEFKETVETNLLVLEKEMHSKELESRRKAFRCLTCLKKWPLQDMAMDHLDHLLGINAKSQFHGGDYLSSESSSSIESMDQKRRVASSSIEKEDQSKVCLKEFDSNSGPLWSREPRIFATEKAQGKRKYLVGHFGRIVDWYWRKSGSKHLYEVIRESTPCRLYFDLEYSKIHNPNVDQTPLLNQFRQELTEDFKEHFQIDLQPTQIVDMDSSTDIKFSRHWILDIPGCLFEDAPTAGRFVKRLVSRLAEELGTGQLKDRQPELAKHLFVNTKEEGKTSCFIDLGVYTRNRLFRVFGSSKFGKKATLEIAQENKYPIELPVKQPPTERVQNLEDYIAANNWELHAKVLAKTLVVPLAQMGKDGSNQKDIIRILKVDNDEFVGPFQRGTIKNSNYNSGRVNKFISNNSIRNASTPLPSLDKHVEDVLANRGGTLGSIRAWSIECGPRDFPVSITYQLSRNRFCELIGRSHKSNNIFWTIDISSWTCIQGCHDPECFGRGSPVPIPSENIAKMQEELDTWQEEEFEKALLALNLEEPPPFQQSKRNEISVSTTKNDNDFDDDDFDSAILNAVSSCPELFP